LHRFVFIILALGGCEFRSSHHLPFGGELVNETTATLVEVRAYTPDRDGATSMDTLDVDDCDNRLNTVVGPGERGEFRWPALGSGEGWNIEVVLRPGGCITQQSVVAEQEIVVPAQDSALFSAWSTDCPCEERFIDQPTAE